MARKLYALHSSRSAPLDFGHLLVVCPVTWQRKHLPSFMQICLSAGVGFLIRSFPICKGLAPSEFLDRPSFFRFSLDFRLACVQTQLFQYFALLRLEQCVSRVLSSPHMQGFSPRVMRSTCSSTLIFGISNRMRWKSSLSALISLTFRHLASFSRAIFDLFSVSNLIDRAYLREDQV